VTRSPLRGFRRLVGACLALAAFAAPAAAAGQCPAERAEATVPTDLALCARLEAVVRRPSALPLGEYERTLDAYLGHFCHRNPASGWVRDKRVRDTGPFTSALVNGRWQGAYHGLHAPVVIWYSPEMATWLRANRPAAAPAPAAPAPIPDGALMVKEMYPAPADVCDDVDPLKLYPTNGATIMVREAGASRDGWFWGWYGFGAKSGWAPDWPAGPDNWMPHMGFAKNCLNCHASAASYSTFAAARNIQGEPGEAKTFLSQDFADALPTPSHHRLTTLPTDAAPRLGEPHFKADADVIEALRAAAQTMPTWETVARMPSQTYDATWVGADGPNASDTFLTSSQCIGCHDAGTTGLRFDMTKPNPHGDNLLNMSPYATWRTSPMGLGGRDPVFYAQLASEVETFHPEAADLVQTTCLGCHGILGERQFQIDERARTGECATFRRAQVDAVPWPPGNPTADDANYGMLARDGISCTSCHRMVLGEADTKAHADGPQNACVAERQALLNPDNTGFGRTFTGSFFVGPPDTLYGPYPEPKTKPMENAMGIRPAHNATIETSELCGTCHTVHLPVMQDARIVAHTYEQTTYPEWAFSAYRTGDSPDGALPLGAGPLAQSCQSCHMPSRDGNGRPHRSKIASIQEHSGFPQVENNLGPQDIDLPVRDDFAEHTLVGLNIFLVKMAQQFPDILGIRTEDPMMKARAVDPLLRTEQAMLDQASTATADIAVSDIAVADGSLSARVAVTSKTGHKLPSGVGFRRAFIAFEVLDQNGETLWASGRTNAAGVIVDERGEPLEGELWWKDDCSAHARPGERPHQPHFQEITRQGQAQIYQELVSTPPAGVESPQCGHDASPQGELTTSFLSICSEVKDNRILPKGFLPLDQRKTITRALGAGEDLAEDVGPTAVGDDPDYAAGGGDTTVYRVPLAELPEGARPASVQATLYYQATPPFYLQDRFCTSKGADAQRLYFLAGHLNLDGTQAEGWKLEIVSTGPVAIR